MQVELQKIVENALEEAELKPKGRLSKEKTAEALQNVASSVATQLAEAVSKANEITAAAVHDEVKAADAKVAELQRQLAEAKAAGRTSPTGDVDPGLQRQLAEGAFLAGQVPGLVGGGRPYKGLTDTEKEQCMAAVQAIPIILRRAQLKLTPAGRHGGMRGA